MIIQDSTPAKFEDKLLPNLPKEILEDEYFKQNLPASYGTVSVSPPETSDADHEDGVFGTKLQMCSKGYQELSQNLSAFGQSNASWTASHEKSDPNHSKANNCSTALGDEGRGLLHTPEYGKLNDNLSSIFRGRGEELGLNGDLYTPSNNFGKMNNTNCILNLTDTRQNSDNNKSVHNSTSMLVHMYNTNNNGAEEFANKMESSLGSQYRGGSDMAGLFDTLRYQNVTYDNLGSMHPPISVDVRPYGIAKYTFLAQFDNELSLNEGDMVYLRKYIDKEWMEGEVDGTRGLVPIGYVNVIVDCLEVVEEIPASAQQPQNVMNTGFALGVTESDPTYTNSENIEAKIKPDTYHKVLFTFQAQINGGLNVVSGEVIRVLEKTNENTQWIMVENSYGKSGLCPTKYLNINNEPDGRAHFVFNRWLNYKGKKEQNEQEILE